MAATLPFPTTRHLEVPGFTPDDKKSQNGPDGSAQRPCGSGEGDRTVGSSVHAPSQVPSIRSAAPRRVMLRHAAGHCHRAPTDSRYGRRFCRSSVTPYGLIARPLARVRHGPSRRRPA